jgi:hypothetical protein
MDIENAPGFKFEVCMTHSLFRDFLYVTFGKEQQARAAA